MAQLCGVHGTEMNLRDGQWGKYWSCGKKNADGSWCKWKAPKPTTEMQKFDDSLNKSASHMDASKKDETITRLAIAKSLIEAGRNVNDEAVMVFKEAEKWFDWVYGRSVLAGHLNDSTPVTVNEALRLVGDEKKDDTDLASIPF